MTRGSAGGCIPSLVFTCLNTDGWFCSNTIISTRPFVYPKCQKVGVFTSASALVFFRLALLHWERRRRKSGNISCFPQNDTSHQTLYGILIIAALVRHRRFDNSLIGILQYKLSALVYVNAETVYSLQLCQCVQHCCNITLLIYPCALYFIKAPHSPQLLMLMSASMV